MLGFLGAPMLLAGGKDGDLFAPYVALLMHMDGPDGGTSFPDVVGHAIESTGYTISTSQSKSNGSSAYSGLSGTPNIKVLDAADLRLLSSDFSIEGFAHSTAWGGAARLIGKEGDGSQRNGFALLIGSGGYLQLLVANSSSSFGVNVSTDYGIVSLGTWFHWCIERVGSTWTIYVNGTQVAQAIDASFSVFDIGAPIVIGAGYNGIQNNFWGYLDEIRITIGVHRYGAPFSVPAVPFIDP